jgi:hypothetical protein
MNMGLMILEIIKIGFSDIRNYEVLVLGYPKLSRYLGNDISLTSTSTENIYLVIDNSRHHKNLI